jgi:mitogen-activated protein kinase 1/3
MEEYYDITSRRSREYIRALPFRAKKSFESLYPMASPAAIDFLKKTLTCKSYCFRLLASYPKLIARRTS